MTLVTDVASSENMSTDIMPRQLWHTEDTENWKKPKEARGAKANGNQREKMFLWDHRAQCNQVYEPPDSTSPSAGVEIVPSRAVTLCVDGVLFNCQQ